MSELSLPVDGGNQQQQQQGNGGGDGGDGNQQQQQQQQSQQQTQTQNNNQQQQGNQNSQGAAPATWRNFIPDEYKNEESLKIIPDEIPSLIKMLVSSQRMVGSEKVALPSKHATEDDIQAFYDRLGRPQLDKYEVELPKDAKFVNDQKFMERFKPLAHKLGIMPKQLSGLLGEYEKYIGEVDTANKQMESAKLKEGLDGLKKEWGGAYKHKLNYAHQVLREHGNDELGKILHENPAIGDNPQIIKLLSKVGELLYKEDNVPEGENNSSILAPAEALKKAQAIMGDMNHPYNLGDHLNHKNAVKEVQDLMNIAYSGDAGA